MVIRLTTQEVARTAAEVVQRAFTRESAGHIESTALVATGLAQAADRKRAAIGALRFIPLPLGQAAPAPAPKQGLGGAKSPPQQGPKSNGAKAKPQTGPKSPPRQGPKSPPKR